MKKQQQGFTLIELIVVIVILGILAAIAVPKYLDVKKDATDNAKAMTDNSTTEHNANHTACTSAGLTGCN